MVVWRKGREIRVRKVRFRGPCSTLGCDLFSFINRNTLNNGSKIFSVLKVAVSVYEREIGAFRVRSCHIESSRTRKLAHTFNIPKRT